MFIALKSLANGKYVCADNVGRSPLIANKDRADVWETFQKIDLGSDLVALKSLANCKYVFPVGLPWAQLRLQAVSDNPHPHQLVRLGGNRIALKCILNGKFVCAENAGWLPLVANRDHALSWESFEEVDRSACYAEPHLAGANIVFSTCDENKDHDTAVSVFIKINRNAPIAWIQNAAVSGNGSTEYPDHSRRSLSLFCSGEVPKSQCNDIVVTIGAKAVGNDTWRFSASAILFFTDGTAMFKNSGYRRELSSRGSGYVEINF